MEETSGKSHDFSSLTKDISSRLTSLSTDIEGLTQDRNSYMDLKISLLLMHYSTYLCRAYNSTSPSNPTSAPTIQPSDPHSKSLIKLKCFIDRLKPLDHKLQYQLDKVAQGSIDSDLRLKANPSTMDSQLRVTEKEGVYKPPKVQAVLFKDKKTQRDEERLKKKLSRSSLIKSLKEEFDDAPLEIRSGKNKKLRKIEEEQNEFEEDNFMRINLTKEDKKFRRKLAKQDDEDQGEDINALLKLIRPDKKKLKDTLDYGKKKRKINED
jgi:hypothetical protein